MVIIVLSGSQATACGLQGGAREEEVTDIYRTTLEIAAEPATVFDHFVQPELLVRWMGDYARLRASAGGEFSVDINGLLIRGHFVRVERPHLLEVTWGEPGNASMPPGATRVVVRFVPIEGGTRLELEHAGLTREEAKKHALGWSHFLARLRVCAAGGDPGVDPWRTR
jgi:uncharacterized protein YndB with AHSA1/START domain